MATTIKDGSSGNIAQVDEENRLYVLANTIEHLQHHSWTHQNAYIVNFDTVMADANEAPVAFFKNEDSDNDFEFYVVTISTDAAATVRIYFEGEYTSGGAEVSAINMFRGSGQTLTRELFYEGGASGNLVVDSTNAVKASTLYINANQPTPFDFQGALVFRNNRTAYMTIEAAGGTNVSVTALTAFHQVGTKL